MKSNPFATWQVSPEPTRAERVADLKKRIASCDKFIRAFKESYQYARQELEEIKRGDLQAQLDKLLAQKVEINKDEEIGNE